MYYSMAWRDNLENMSLGSFIIVMTLQNTPMQTTGVIVSHPQVT